MLSRSSAVQPLGCPNRLGRLTLVAVPVACTLGRYELASYSSLHLCYRKVLEAAVDAGLRTVSPCPLPP